MSQFEHDQYIGTHTRTLTLNAAKVVKALRAALPRTRAVVAGGYLRDMLHGIPPKDMDVFVMSDDGDGPTAALLQAIQVITGPINWLCVGGEYWGADSCLRVGEAQVDHDGNLHPVPINVIVLQKGILPADDARLNDFGMCQIWYDGERLQWTDAFLRDSVFWTFTLKVCEDVNQFARSMRRWERLRQKFPYHTLVIPPEFKEFEEACSSASVGGLALSSPASLLP